jgi:hypothetical protein
MPKTTAKERRRRRQQNASRKERESRERAMVTEAARIQAHQEAVEKGRHSTDVYFNTMRDLNTMNRLGKITPDLKIAIEQSAIRRNQGKDTVITHDGTTWKAHSPSNVSSSSSKKKRRKKGRKKGGFKKRKTRKTKNTRRRY